MFFLSLKCEQIVLRAGYLWRRRHLNRCSEGRGAKFSVCTRNHKFVTHYEAELISSKSGSLRFWNEKTPIWFFKFYEPKWVVFVIQILNIIILGFQNSFFNEIISSVTSYQLFRYMHMFTQCVGQYTNVCACVVVYTHSDCHTLKIFWHLYSLKKRLKHEKI